MIEAKLPSIEIFWLPYSFVKLSIYLLDFFLPFCRENNKFVSVLQSFSGGVVIRVSVLQSFSRKVSLSSENVFDGSRRAGYSSIVTTRVALLIGSISEIPFSSTVRECAVECKT